MAFLEKRGGLVPVYVFIFPAEGSFGFSKPGIHNRKIHFLAFRCRASCIFDYCVGTKFTADLEKWFQESDLFSRALFPFLPPLLVTPLPPLFSAPFSPISPLQGGPLH